MKVELLWDDSNKQEALMSKTVTATWANLHLAREQSDNATIEATKYVGPHKSHMHQYITKLAHQGQAISP
jgi:hypothetical protein